MTLRTVLIVGTAASVLSACAWLNPPAAKETKHAQYNPKAATINVQLGMGYLRKGNMVRAKTKLLAALKQDPKSALAHDAMAYFLEQSGNVEAATEHYRKAIKYGGEKGEHLNNYGAFLCRQGQYRESLPYFVKATLDSNYVNVADAFENAGFCSESIPDHKQAKHYFSMALKREPQRVTSMLALARANYQLKNYDEADKHLTAFMASTKPTAESTYLGYRIAKRLGHTRLAASFATTLKQQFADTSEYSAYQKSKGVTA